MRNLRLLLLLGVAALPAAGVSAQSPELLRVDSLLDRSRFTAARIALRQWTESAAARRPDDVAYGLLLRARLASAADSALAAWLELALGHPSSRFAPDALLRLGQGYLTLGQPARAAEFLQRIPRDYPAYPHRALAETWLARARSPAGPASTPATGAGNTPAAGSTPPAGAAAPHFAVQVAAFSRRADAVELGRRLRAEGITARVVIRSGSTLYLVRAGLFPSTAAAAPLLRRLRARFPDAHVVADTGREAAASR